MTNEERAERLRKVATAPTLTIEGRQVLVKVADELDPPGLAPGTVVIRSDGVVGFLSDKSNVHFHNGYGMRWDKLGTQWKPARIAGPMQETATIPPLDQWPEDAKYCEVAIVFNRHTDSRRVQRVITRDEAARRESEG